MAKCPSEREFRLAPPILRMAVPERSSGVAEMPRRRGVEAGTDRRRVWVRLDADTEALLKSAVRQGETLSEAARRALIAGLEIGQRLERIEALLTAGVVASAQVRDDPKQPDPDELLRRQFVASIEAFAMTGQG
jgi:hypothetical protein